MARPEVIINPVRGENLKKLIEMEGLKQKEFAASINYSSEMISQIIHGHKNLNEYIIDAIVEKYPKYNKQWLLGLSDYPTEQEKAYGELGATIERLADKEKWFAYSASLVGMMYKQRLVNPNDPKGKVILNDDDDCPWVDENGNEVFPELKHELISEDGTLALENDEVTALEDEILRFISFRLGEVFRMKGVQ